MFLSWIIELPLISSSMTWFIVYSGDFNKTSVAPSEIVISCILIRYHLICFHSEGFAFLMQDNYVKKHPVWFIYIFLTLFFSIWRQFFAFPLCAVDHQLALLLLTIKMKESGRQVFFKELKKSHILSFFFCFVSWECGYFIQTRVKFVLFVWLHVRLSHSMNCCKSMRMVRLYYFLNAA